MGFLECKSNKMQQFTLTTVVKKPTHAHRYRHFTPPQASKTCCYKTLHNRIGTHVTKRFLKYELHKQI